MTSGQWWHAWQAFLLLHHIYLWSMLIISIVHHGNHPFLLVLDAWHFLDIEEAGLVPIKFANEKDARENLRTLKVWNDTKMKVICGDDDDDDDDLPVDRFSTTPRPSGIASLHDEVSLRRRQAHCNSKSVSTGQVGQYSFFTSTGFKVHTLHWNLW